MIEKLEPVNLGEVEREPSIPEIMDKINEIIDHINPLLNLENSSNIESFYKEVAYHCWVSRFGTGEYYEGMRIDFEKLWEERRAVVKEHIKKSVEKL